VARHFLNTLLGIGRYEKKVSTLNKTQTLVFHKVYQLEKNILLEVKIRNGIVRV